MSSAATPRRHSRRERKSSSRFNDQVDWDAALHLLRADSNSPDRSSDSSTPESIEKLLDPDADAELLADANSQAEDEDEDSEDSLPASSAIVTAGEDEPDQSQQMSSTTVIPSRHRRKIVPGPKTKAIAADRGTRSRMFNEDLKILRWSKTKAWKENFGAAIEDLYPILRTRDVWHGAARDVVLPSRRSARLAIDLEARSQYINGHSFKTSSLKPSVETQSVDNNASSRPFVQRMHQISEAQCREHNYVAEPLQNQVVLGSFDKSVKSSLHPEQPLNTLRLSTRSAGRGTTEESGPGRSEDHAPDQDGIDSLQTNAESRSRSGRWLINVGARPSNIAWAPSMADEQYLAISVTCTMSQRNTTNSPTSPHAPAFSATPPYPSHLQIWCFSVQGESTDPALLATVPSPQLTLTLATRWGNNLTIEWLPLPLRPTSDMRALACLSSDGNIRVVDVHLSHRGAYEIEQAAFIASPPEHTVYTCFTIPSHEDLIAGGADGVVYLYNIKMLDATEPYATIQLHNTYIVALSVATDHSHFLASSSAAGDTQLIDLRAPEQERVRVHRSRLPTRNLSYSPLLHTFFTTIDAAGNSEAHGTSLSTLAALNMRHFYKTTTVLKLPEQQGIATALSLSPFHPFALVANAAGQVFCTNVLRRMLPATLKDGEALCWMVKLFEIEWTSQPMTSTFPRPSAIHSEAMDVDRQETLRTPIAETTGQVDGSNEDFDVRDVFNGQDSRPGITRIHDGFRPVPAELTTFDPDSMNLPGNGKNKESRRANGIPSAASYQCIYPEEQAVTSMAWNPNARFSTWAALAWGSGIVCITDLGHGMA